MAYNLGNANGNIRLTYDSRGVAHARNDLGQFVSMSLLARQEEDRHNKSVRNLSLSFGKLGKALLKATKYITITASAIQTAISTFNLLAGVIAALAPAIGATLATLPALIFSILGAALVLKAAFIGVGDALKAAVSGDAAKLAEATKNLAPSAKAFAQEIFNATKALKPMQQAIQQAFFEGLAKQIPGIVTALKSIQTQAVGVSASFGRFANVFAVFLQSPQFTNAMQQALLAVSKLLDAITPGLLPVLQGFATLAANGAHLAQQMNSNLLPAMQRFGDFLTGLDLRTLFANAAEALRPLVALFANLGTILSAVFSALGGGNAQGALSVVGSIVDKVAEFAKSEAGIKAFDALAKAISAIAGAAGDVLLQALDALGPVVVALSPLLTVLARVLGSVLTDAIKQLAPIVLSLAQILNETLGPILPIIGDAIRQVVDALAPLIETLLGVLQPLLEGLSPVIGALADSLGKILAAAIQSIIPMIQDMAPLFQDIAEQILPQLVPLFEELATVIADNMPFIMSLNQLLIGVLVPVLRLLVPVIMLVVEALTLLFRGIDAISKPFNDAVLSMFTAVNISNAVVAAFRWLLDQAIAIFGELWHFVTAIWSGLGSLLSSIGGVISNVIGFFANLRNGIAQNISNAVNTVRGFPGQITAAIGNLGSLLFSAGQQVVQGMVNGIQSMAGRVLAAAKQVVSGIPDAIKGLLGISSPSKVTMALGREVPRGLAQGILDTLDDVRRAAQRAADQVTLGIPTTLGATVTSAVTATLGAATAPPSTAPVVVQPSAAAPVINQTLVAPQNMDPTDVANLSARRIQLAIATGA